MAEEPTSGEVYRLVQSVLEQMRDLRESFERRMDAMEARYVSQAVFQAEQEATRRIHETITKDLSDWKAESRGEHARLDGRLNTFESEVDGKFDGVKSEIKAERERSDQIERSANSKRGDRMLSIGLASLSAVIAVAAILVNVIGGG